MGKRRPHAWVAASSPLTARVPAHYTVPVRVVLFLQVVVLFALAAFVILLQLENPVLVRVPVPWVQQEVLLPLGVLLGLTLLVGGAYAALLFLPRLALAALARRGDARRRRALEEQLSATLQAKLTAPARPTLAGQDEDGELPDLPAAVPTGGAA